MQAFIRFDLGAWNQLPEPMELLSVTLWLYYLDRASPTVGANLYGIDDFGALGEADWGLTVRRGFGEFVNPGTVEDQWIARDVLPALLDAVGESHVAFELQYADESQDPGGQSRWYKFTAADSGEAWAPRLVIMYVPG